MVNQVVLVGYIYSDKELKQTLQFNGDCYIELNRNFQDVDGQYQKERFKVRLWRGMHDTIREDAEGSLVCLKGRLENDNNEVIIVAEKITIIQETTSKKGQSI